ncbi:MAG: hypothetical protein R2800_09875 [Flavipsychrobacter sp.]
MAKATKKSISFVMSDESVNFYGFRVLTAGIDYSDFLNNPVGFWNHRNEDEYKEEALLPLFRWENIRVENSKLIGDLVPDEDDEESMKVYGKIERGFVNACSVTIEPIEISEAPEDMLPGQTLPTFTKSRLSECSPCGLPGNYNALKLKAQGKYISLNNQTKQEEVQQFLSPINNNQNKNVMDNKLVLTLSALLGCGATEAEVTQAVNTLKAKLSAAEQAKTAIEGTLKEVRELHAKPLIDKAIELGNSTEEEREGLVELSATSPKLFSSMMLKLTATGNAPDGEEGKGGAPSINNVNNVVQKLNANQQLPKEDATPANNGECEFDILSKTNPLELKRIKQEEPERFQKLYAEKRNRLNPKARAGANA